MKMTFVETNSRSNDYCLFSRAGMELIERATERRCRQSEQLATFLGSLAEQIRSTVTDLRAFIQPELSFGLQARYRETFCRRHVREMVVVGFFRHFVETCRGFCDVAGGEKTSPSVLLLLSRACRDLDTSTVHYLVSLRSGYVRIWCYSVDA